MEMTIRWYGSKYDTVTLQQIRQIPGVKGVITTLYGTQPGEVWAQEKIHALKEEVQAADDSALQEAWAEAERYNAIRKPIRYSNAAVSEAEESYQELLILNCNKTL